MTHFIIIYHISGREKCDTTQVTNKVKRQLSIEFDSNIHNIMYIIKGQ